MGSVKLVEQLGLWTVEPICSDFERSALAKGRDPTTKLYFQGFVIVCRYLVLLKLYNQTRFYDSVDDVCIN